MDKVIFKHLIISTAAPLIFSTINTLSTESFDSVIQKSKHYFITEKYVMETQLSLESITFISGGSLLSASNAAIHSLSRSLAIELAPVRVTVVSPGSTKLHCLNSCQIFLGQP